MTDPTSLVSSPLQYRHILVPLDGSDDATVALRTARALAARLGATVHTVSAAITAKEKDYLHAKAADALDVHPDDKRVYTVVSDKPALAIHDRADELGSCLICMTTHGHGRVIGSVVGSVARSVMQEHRRPLVVVGRLADRKDYFETTWPEPLSVDRIVVCVDDTPAADAAVTVAADWAKALAMSLTILTIAVPTVSLSGEDASNQIEAALQRLCGLVAGRSIDVGAHLAYDPLGPAAGVSAYLSANPAGLLVVSTHARSGVSRLVRGATAASIVAVANVAAVVVPLPD